MTTSMRRLKPRLLRGGGLFRDPMTRNRILLFVSVVLVGLLAGCGLSSEPEIAQEIAMPTPAPTLAVPSVMPDLAEGAVFFAEHCAACHGDTGQGDGVMVMDGRLENAPPDFTDAATAFEQTPLDYMDAITNGNMLALMPPFSNYSEEERWNVAAYVYTGAATQDSLTLGAAVYETQCASCHGDGTGNGPDAPGIMPDLTDLDFWAQNSNASLYAKISTGVMPGMPGFGDDLGETEIRAAVDYLRTLAMNGTPGFVAAAPAEPVAEEEPPAPEATEEVSEPAASAAGDGEPAAEEGGEDTAETEETAAPQTITVTGQVTNGTPDGGIPADMPITLHMFDSPDFTETTIEGVVNADGTYTFDDVPYADQRVYLLSLQYADVFFSTTVYEVTDLSNPTIDTTLEIYETTSDPSVLSYEAGVMRITFTHFGMEVAEVLSVSNTSDRLFLTDEIFNENQRVALRIPLPPGAGGVGFEPGMQGTRFFTNLDETEIIDTQPVRPGREDIFFSFFIPYEDGAIIEQVLSYPFSGPFHLLIEADQVQVEGVIFAEAGDRVDMGGMAFDAYVAELGLNADEVLTFTLSGTPAAVSALREGQQPASGGSLPPLVIVLIVVGVILLGAGGFVFLLRQDTSGASSRDAEINDLLEEIADLDNRHDQGDINHDVYQRTRAKLKAELAELMRDEQDDA